ncbi:MAG: dockerin type I repeat-containing protein [Treponema sp.]|nr:dockerin type I repeat-containing protein [Treponema sp.]
MKVHITINKKVTGSRLHMLLLLLTTALASFAQNVTVSIADFEIAPGEQKTVDILVTNDIAYGTDFGGDIYLPEGLKVVANEDGDYLTRNMTRCTTSHGLTTATQAENPALAEGQIRFSLVSQSAKTLKGNEGAVLSFTVEATDALAEDSKIELKDAFITNTSASHVKADCEANVHNANYITPALTLTAQDFVLTPSKEVTVSFAFATNIEVSAFQADITLPEGLEFVTNEEGDYATFNMSRLTSSHTPGFYLNGNKLNIQLSSSKSSNLKGEDGELFAVTLRATTDLKAESVIAISRVIASTSAGKRQDIPAIEVKVSNPDVDAKAAADKAVEELAAQLNQLTAGMAAYAEEVQAAFKTQLDEAAAAFSAIESALATDAANGDVAANADARHAEMTALQESIAKIAADAADAQKKYEEEAAAAAANDAQYKLDLAAIADVQDKLDAATNTVAEYADSVQASFVETIDALEASVDNLTATAKASYQNGTSVADAAALQESAAAVVAKIEKLLGDAADAQKAYEEAHSKKIGDIDENGTVDINDLTLIRDLILEKISTDEISESQKKAADVNGDGNISVVDLVTITNVIVYGNPNGPVASSAMNANAIADVRDYLDLQMAADRMGITLNSTKPYAAIQMDVMLPEGVSLNDVSFAGASEQVMVASNVLNNGACRIVMYTTDNSAILSGASQLLTLSLAGEGCGVISVDNIIVATAKGEGYELSAVSANHTIITGIDGVEANGVSKFDVFSINGMQNKSLKKGVNIVRDHAGHVKKMLVK